MKRVPPIVTPVLRTRLDDGDTASVQLVEVLAALTGVEPTDLSPPFAEVLDPDSIDALFTGPFACKGLVTLEFTYQSYDVRVDSEGEVLVFDSGLPRE